MRTVTFKSVLNGIAKRLGLEVSTVQAVDLATHEESINERVREGWEHDWFPEWTLTELRTYRAAYDAGTAYSATNEVYLPGANAYYQALRATTGNVPATESGGTWTADPAYWSLCAAGYSAPEWETAHDYVAGDQVLNPVNGLCYSCHTAHTSAGSTVDLTKFGLLTPFAAYVALDQAGQTPIAECKQLSSRDPRVFPKNAGVIRQKLTEAGIVPLGCAFPMQIWVTFRTQPPVFTVTAWGSGTAYAIGDLAYDATTGECYKSIQAGTNHAVTDTAYWTRVKFPFAISSYVKCAVFADALRADGQNDAADKQDDVAKNQLSKASDVALEGQGQYETATAITY